MRCFKAVQELCQGKGKEGGRLSQLVFTDKWKGTAVIPKGLGKSMQKYSTFSWTVFIPLCPSYMEHTGYKKQQCLGHTGCLLLLLSWRCHSVCTAAYVLSYLMLACSFNSAPVVCCWVMLIFVSWLPGVNSIANNLFSCCLMQSQQKRQHLISHCSQLLFWGAIWVNQLASQRISTPLARFFWGFMDPLK